MPNASQALYPLAPMPVAHMGVPARWSTVPAPGTKCQFTGLGHGYYYSKLLAAPFSYGFVHLNLGGKTSERGKRLFFIPSLHDLLSAIAHGKLRVGLRGRLTSKIPGHRFAVAREFPLPQQWLRVPANGKTCWFTGLGHFSFYALLEQAGDRIPVSGLQRPGESRATRLVFLPEVHEYLVSLAEAQAPEFSPPRIRHVA